MTNFPNPETAFLQQEMERLLAQVGRLHELVAELLTENQQLREALEASPEVGSL